MQMVAEDSKSPMYHNALALEICALPLAMAETTS